MKRIDITPEIEHAVRRYALACARFVPGRDSAGDVELPLLEIGRAAAAAIGLPGLRELFDRRSTVRVKARPAKARLTLQAPRKAVR